MPVDKPEVVDIIGLPPNAELVALTISDHLRWEDSRGHLTALQEKLNRYLAFIESGELLEKYPDATGKPVQIDIVFKYRPSGEGESFLTEAKSIVVKAGFDLTWRTLAA